MNPLSFGFYAFRGVSVRISAGTGPDLGVQGVCKGIPQPDQTPLFGTVGKVRS